MKPIVTIISTLSLILFSTAVSGCAKNDDDSSAPTCKTCKALGSGPDQQTIQKEVCTADEEKAFRSSNAGREIICK